MTMRYVSHADLGGRSGFDKIEPEAEGVVFHADWESRVLALTLAMGATGSWNLDMGRSARETLPGYTELSYYEIWLAALEKLLVGQGLVSPDELTEGRSLEPPRPVRHILEAVQVGAVLAKGSPTERVAPGPAIFRPGQRVRARSTPAEHHTRLPGYLRGKRGVVERVVGPHVFPDSNATGAGEDTQWLYTVVFTAVELWGDAARPGDLVSCDAFQPYLEAA